jgi:pyruvate/2-oxoacid:ferredoxin oxidoreductase alpha subunit
MADLTTLAFDLADEYRNPVVVLADGNIGQMMEPVEFAARARRAPAAGVGREGHRGDPAQPADLALYLEPD